MLQNKMVVIGILMSEMSEDITATLTAINMGKHGIIDPTIITPTILKTTIMDFENIYRTRYYFEGTVCLKTW